MLHESWIGGDSDVPSLERSLARAIEVFEREGPQALEHWLEREGGESAPALRQRIDILRGAGLLTREPGPASGEPALIGRFVVLRRLGAGATGLVYLARDPANEALVAVKVLAPQFSQEPRVRERFRRESRATGRLRHQSLVGAREFGEERGELYSVLDYVEGTSLELGLARLRETGRAPEDVGPDELVDAFRLDANGRARVAGGLVQTSALWTRDLALALAHAHASGIVHRDVKPSNVVIQPSGHLCLVDFGLAHVVDDARLTWSGDILGTPKYVAPEVVRDGIGRSDHRVDVFALGVCLYELATLRAPFDGVSSAQVMQRVLELDPPPPSRSNAQATHEFDAVCAVALAKSPNRRYRSAQAFADDLERFLDGRPVDARTPGPIEVAWQWTRRRPLASAVGAIVLVALVATTVIVTAYNRELERRSEIARAAQTSAETSLSFLVELLEMSDVEEHGPDVPARRLLEEGASRVRDASRWSGEERVRAQLARALGALSWGAGDLPAARELLELSTSIFSASTPKNVDEPAWILERSKALNYLGNVRRAQGSRSDAIVHYRASLAAVGELDASSNAARDQEATICANLGDVLTGLGMLDEAEAMMRRALSLRSDGGEEEVANRAWSLIALARLQVRREDIAGANDSLEEASRVATDLEGRHLQKAALVDAAAQIATSLGEHERAARLLEQHAEIYAQALGPRSVARGEVLVNLGEVWWLAGRLSECERTLLEAESILADVAGGAHHKLPEAYQKLGACAFRSQRYDEALRRARQAAQAWERHPEWTQRHGEVFAWLLTASSYARLRCEDEARAAFAEAEGIARACCSDVPNVAITVELARARIEHDVGDLERGIAACHTALAVIDGMPSLDWRRLEIETELATLEARRARPRDGDETSKIR